MDAFADMEMKSLAAQAAAEKRIVLIEWDLNSTLTAAVWTVSTRRGEWNAKLRWDRVGLRANRFQWKAKTRHNSSIFRMRVSLDWLLRCAGTYSLTRMNKKEHLLLACLMGLWCRPQGHMVVW